MAKSIRQRFWTLVSLAALGVLWAGLWVLHAVGDDPKDQPAAPAEPHPDRAALEQAQRRIAPLVEKLTKPAPGDWLYHHREPGQSFRQWLDSDPPLPNEVRKAIYIQPIGPIDKTRRQIVQATVEVLGCSYNLPVRALEPVGLEAIPASARRTSRWGERQLLTGYILEKILLPRRPKDAAALLGLTAEDLWPGKGWNFVFGQASLRRRVGVWSMRRFGDPARSDRARRTVLLRTIKTALHETGHMFGMAHCTAGMCLMNGSNSLEESDLRPLTLCAACMAKACVIGRIDPARRYRRLEAFCRKHGLDAQARQFAARAEALDDREQGAGPGRLPQRPHTQHRP
jgi:archaemetzincin